MLDQKTMNSLNVSTKMFTRKSVLIYTSLSSADITLIPIKCTFCLHSKMFNTIYFLNNSELENRQGLVFCAPKPPVGAQ